MEQNTKYVVNTFNSSNQVVSIERLKGLDNPWMLKEGIRLGIGEEFPEDAVFPIYEDSGDILTDFIDNISSQIMINEKVKSFFIKSGITEDFVEYLPFKICDKQGEILDEQYYICNPIQKYECLDVDKSDVYTRKSGKIVGVNNVALNEDKIPDDALIFRLGEVPSEIILKRDFVEKVDREGFTGLICVPTGTRLS